MRFNPLLTICALVALTIVGCTPKAPEGQPSGNGNASSENKLRIAVIPKGATHEFWKSVHAGAKDAEKELGNVEIIWKGPMKEDDRQSQIEVVETFITDKVDGIVIAPLDNVALVKPIENAVSSQIPVVVIDSGVKSTKYTSFVATDNFKGGELAAKRLVEVLGGKGNVVMLRYQPGSASTMEREDGFLNELKKAKGIKLIQDNQYGGPTTESAQQASENIVASFKKPDGTIGIDGIFCPNESSTFGMLRVLQENKLTGKIKFVGFDASAKLVDALKAGEINGLVLQNPRNMGYLGVKTLVEAIGKKKVENRIDTGATMVTKENMTDPEIAKLLAPPPADL